MDRRRTPFSGRVAHVSLRGTTQADSYTEGTPATVCATVTGLFPSADPGCHMDRELVLGDALRVLDRQQGRAFVQAARDGYCGWLAEEDIAETAAPPATHVVSARATGLYQTPDFKQTFGARAGVSLGSRLHVAEDDGRWARVLLPQPDRSLATMFAASRHLRPIDTPEIDPVAVAERLLGAPYLWGGNSERGIDCSGLVQIACLMCGIPCPGDSDMQARELGETLPPQSAFQRGDLLFWKGHVAWVANPATLLHANVHHMAVAFEPLDEAITRIAAQGDGDVIRHARLPARPNKLVQNLTAQ